MRALVIVAALASAAHADPDGALAPADVAFEDQVARLADHTARHVLMWGTLRLDGSRRRYRFATLEPDVDEDFGDGRIACAHRECRGAYVIEQSPTRYWLITYGDQFASPFGPPASDDPRVPAALAGTWQVLDATAIDHAQLHNHGKEYVSFALRDGDLVVLADRDYHSRNGDTTRICVKTCPPLASFRFQSIDMIVDGPARSIAALHERRPMGER